MSSLVYILAAGVVALFLYFFGSERKKINEINRAKIPESVLQNENLMREMSQKYEVPLDILWAVSWVESTGRMSAIGSAGERGIMQLKEIAVKDLQQKGIGKFRNFKTDPKQNIAAGAAYLKLQYDRTGSWMRALKAYNQGFQGMKDNPEKAAEYMQKVKSKMRFFS